MSHELINRNADLKRLREEGYSVQINGGFLLMRQVPYVDSSRNVQRGTLISSLCLAGDQTRPPDPHTIYFVGEYPCRANGEPIEGIRHQSHRFDLGHGLVAQHQFSSKPQAGYRDYYEKMTTYANLLAGAAASVEPGVTPRIFRTPEEEEKSVFNYVETASDRAGIGALTDQLRSERVGIIGLGGTGSYILDLVAKTPVREIRLFDDDEFLQHNAFRAPGAPSIEELREAKHKVEYLHGIYSRMHRGIIAHPTRLNEGNMGLLDGLTFCFLCLDSGKAKRNIVEKLEAIGASFIDVGMGLELDEGSLGGILRVTSSTPERREAFHNGRVPLGDGGDRGLYSSNIQVADLNSLNASLAVIKWKKLRGFYRDLEKEIHCTYTTDGNMLDNGVR